MPIHDKELEELTEEQTKLFNENAPLKDKIEVFKKIQKRQKKLMKVKDND